MTFAASMLHSESITSLHSYGSGRAVNVSTWRNEEVVKWLSQNQLDHVADR